MNIAYLDSPVGQLRLCSDGECLVAIEFPGRHGNSAGDEERSDPVLARTASQLAEYFDGKRREFDLPLGASGTDFQHEVWAALQEIPYGQLRSYAQVAGQIGHGDAVRAVGRANGDNRIAILIPCHRVVGSDGEPTGYGGGIWRKEYLLAMEQAQAFHLI